MKANELMIGDYVNYRGQIIKVTSLYDKGGSNEVGWGDKESVWVNASNVEPISLTAEILEKNGFERLDAGYRLKKAYLILSCSSREDNPKVFWLRVSYSECRIEYVHQLQHVLRVVWRNDIADNFKV